jgi:PAS domain-containing protein
MSVALVVCDVDRDDNPVIYCSESFERLTLYSKEEVLDRNPRFLQEPPVGAHGCHTRPIPIDEQMLRLKEGIQSHRETQVTIMNYKKTGEPFMNFMSVIPITWDTDRIRYMVGFISSTLR